MFDTQREIKVCTGYRYKGSPIKEMPASAEESERLRPCIKHCPAGARNLRHDEDAAKLPKAATDYLQFVSDFLQVEIGMISTGPERDATIVQPGTLFSRWL